MQTDNSEDSDDSTSTLTSSSSSSGDEGQDDVGHVDDETAAAPSNVAAAATTGPPSLPPGIAILKLEQKFKDAMAKCADLSFEKERLEHIVVQLQEETDTVGEWRFT